MVIFHSFLYVYQRVSIFMASVGRCWCTGCKAHGTWPTWGPKKSGDADILHPSQPHLEKKLGYKNILLLSIEPGFWSGLTNRFFCFFFVVGTLETFLRNIFGFLDGNLCCQNLIFAATRISTFLKVWSFSDVSDAMQWDSTESIMINCEYDMIYHDISTINNRIHLVTSHLS